MAIQIRYGSSYYRHAYPDAFKVSSGAIEEPNGRKPSSRIPAHKVAEMNVCPTVNVFYVSSTHAND